MYACRTAFVALAVIVSLRPEAYAQQSNLTFSLFERSLDQLRQDSGIPGISVIIVQNQRVVWERGLGMADLERSIAAAPDTPYLVGDLTQTLSSTLVLQLVDRGYDIRLTDRMARWMPSIVETEATVEQVLRHTSTGSFQYSPSRFAAVTPVLGYYHKNVPFRKLLADEILEQAGMFDSVPGHDMAQPSPLDVPFFDQGDLARYAAVVQRLAVPYRVDLRRRPTRSDYPDRGITAGTGLISTVRDLAKFDAALDDSSFFLRDPELRDAMLRPAGSAGRTGLGWFVQPYNGLRLVWHFGNIPNGFSSLILKVPERGITLILLANSDGLSAPFALDQGDVTTSLFARLFLRTFLP